MAAYAETGQGQGIWEVAVKDVYELLREKETVILRLRQEIEALRCVIPLLSDDLDQPDAETSEWQGLDAPGTGTAGKKFWT